MVLLYHWKSVTVLSTPIIFFYIIIIILTILSLDKKLSFFAGAVSAIEFVIILIYILSKYDYPDELAVLNVWYIHGGKALLILLSGILSGIIADQLRKKIYSAFELYGERTRVVNLFSQQVSQQIVDELISQTEELKGKRKFVCVMFLDIRGFTRFAETLEPEEIIEYQNKVFGFMIDIILNNHGIINQFLGDGYMATFGAPISKGNDCENAVRAALSIVEEVNKKSKSGEIPATKIGIGLHAGEVIAGNVGTEARKQYSISGNTVILASRIEELNKKFNSQLLVSGEVINELNGNIESIESFGEVSIKGRAHPISIYKLA
jgi:adenylate cyclase